MSLNRYALTLPLRVTIEIDAATPEAAALYLLSAFQATAPYDALTGVKLRDTDKCQIAYLDATVCMSILDDDLSAEDVNIELVRSA